MRLQLTTQDLVYSTMAPSTSLTAVLGRMKPMMVHRMYPAMMPNKLAAVISIMPQSVLGGAAVMMFASIAVSGIKLVTKFGITNRVVTIVSIAMGLGFGVKFTALKSVSDRLCQENNAEEYFNYGEAMAKLNAVVLPFARALTK